MAENLFNVSRVSVKLVTVPQHTPACLWDPSLCHVLNTHVCKIFPRPTFHSAPAWSSLLSYLLFVIFICCHFLSYLLFVIFTCCPFQDHLSFVQKDIKIILKNKDFLCWIFGKLCFNFLVDTLLDSLSPTHTHVPVFTCICEMYIRFYMKHGQASIIINVGTKSFQSEQLTRY